VKRTPVPEQFRGPEKLSVEYHDVELDGGKTKRVGRIVVAGSNAVWAGGYGISTHDTDRFKNDISFFKIWIGDRGGWSVRYYVSDEAWELTRDSQIWVVKRIAVDPYEAMRLYGYEYTRCGLCGRRLTNDESRAVGIGPVCRERL
jgi:Family of unknown function (DUF6011)